MILAHFADIKKHANLKRFILCVTNPPAQGLDWYISALNKDSFMTSPHTKADLIARLTEVQVGVAQTVQSQSAEQFDRGTDLDWSPASYLKHLLLSNKPFVKGLGRPKEMLESAFGLSERPSMTYDALIDVYNTRIAEGVRAEDSPSVTPITFRIPEGVTDVKAYLVELWQTTHANLVTALADWSEDALDRYQLPHPALNVISIREMLFFTLHHNTVHWGDIRRGSIA